MKESDVIYIADLARILGKTEAAVRSLIARNVELPQSMRIGKKYAWRRADVEAWLRDRVTG